MHSCQYKCSSYWQKRPKPRVKLPNKFPEQWSLYQLQNSVIYSLFNHIFKLKMCKISTAIHSFLCAVLHYWILCGLNKIRSATCNKSKTGTLKLKNVKQNMEMKFKNIISRQYKFGHFLHLFWSGGGSDPPKQGAIFEGFYDKY